MDDPVQTNSFIREIIERQKSSICGLAVTKSGRLTLQKNKSKIEYIISLFLIMGLYHFMKNSMITGYHHFKKKMHSKWPAVVKDPSIAGIAQKYDIKTWQIQTPNNKSFLSELQEMDIDIIVNQSQNILKSGLLSIPKIGVLNRHNALLPKNRGRLTPFWVLYNKEKETAVSIHFVTEELDGGDIIVQKRFAVGKKDNFNSIVKKNYQLAPQAMLEALDILAKDQKNYIKNDDTKATYNTTPSFKEAWKYRRGRLFKI